MRAALVCLVLCCTIEPGGSQLQVDTSKPNKFDIRPAIEAAQNLANGVKLTFSPDFMYLHLVLAEDVSDDLWYKKLPFVNPNQEKAPAIQPKEPVCAEIFGVYIFLFETSKKYYRVIEDPNPLSPDLPLIPLSRVRTCDVDMNCLNCYQTSRCRGCYAGGGANNQYKFRYAFTDDLLDQKRNVIYVGSCFASLQIDCTSKRTCSNGEYASTFLTKDDASKLVISVPECKACRPGTWNTCRKYVDVSPGNCTWCVAIARTLETRL